MRFSAIFLGILSPVVLAPAFANSFTDDSQITLTARNFYFDRDYKQGDPMPAARDWAQGFIFKANSGYTPGTIGLGLDILALAGFNLLGNSADDYAASGLLPAGPDRKRADQYGEIRWTAMEK